MHHKKTGLLFGKQFSVNILIIIFNLSPKALTLILFLFFIGLAASAQVHTNVAPGGNPPGQPGPVTGFSNLLQGAQTTSVYTVTAASGATSYSWGLSTSAAGTISTSSTTATVTWNPSFTGTVTINCLAVSAYGSTAATPLIVRMTAPLVPGIIGPSVITVSYNSTPTIIVESPSGGNGTYTYQWQSAATNNSASFTNIIGLTAIGFPGTGYGATTITYYRRMDSSNGTTLPTNVVEVIPLALAIGNIMPETQDVSAGANVFPLSVSSISGNSSSLTYQWQSSPDNINWTPISGTNSLNYSPPPVSVTTWYRLQVTANGTNSYSRSARVLIGTCPQLNTNPGTTMNYIATSTFRNAGITAITDAQIAGMTICDVNQSIEYLDGLGRSVQTVQTKASPTQRDVVAPVVYDQYNRTAVEYLPYVVPTTSADDGSFKTAALTDQAAFYNNPTSSSSNAPGVVQTAYASGTTSFEPSPLNRPIEQGNPGQSWQVSNSGVFGSGHTTQILYETNNANSLTSTTGYWAEYYGVTYLWTTGNQNTRPQYLYRNALTNPGAYSYGQLYLTITRNENWLSSQSNLNLNTTQEYKDKFGRVVLKRTFNYNTATSANETLSTYYVYDVSGNLVYVLPPLANPDAGGITQSVLDNLCYQYRYDGRSRLVEKKIPGKGWEIMVYNNLDQLIATQDSVQRMYSPQQVSYMKYDAQGRVIQTGYYTLPTSVAAGTDYSVALMTAAIAQTQNWETKLVGGTYSNLTIPTSNANVLTTNYYDDYNNAGAPLTTYAAPAGVSNMTRGLLTGSQTAVLNTPSDQLWDIQYYDDLGRAIKSYSQHYVGGHTSYNTGNYDVSTSYYNFTYQLDTTIRQHYRSSATTPKLTVTNSFTYDQVGRKLQTNEQLAGSNGVAQPAITLSQSIYNQIGQLSIKNIDGSTSSVPANVVLGSANSVPANGTLNVVATNSVTIDTGFSAPAGANFTAKINSSSLQTFIYAYNERGWLTSLTPTISSPGGGNFAEQLYYDYPTSSAMPQYNGNISQFCYNSPYMEAANGKASSNINTVSYAYDNLNRMIQSSTMVGNNNETLSYDLIGNIKTLNRSGTEATPGTCTYNYPVNSNQLSSVTGLLKTYTYDGNGNAVSDSTTKQLTYNMLNLPMAFSIGSSIKATYYYGSDGDKLRNVSVTSGTWDYDKGIVYQNGKLAFIQTEEGKANLASDSITYNYIYDLKDYLGNVRASYNGGSSGNVFTPIQENDYYPFGLSQLYYDNSNGNRYLYNGKEKQFDLTNQYDYGARMYDPTIARWTVVDPDAENSRRWSPYNYVENDPLRNTDPDGMDPTEIYGNPISELQDVYGASSVQSVNYEDETPPPPSDTPDPIMAAAQQVLFSGTGSDRRTTYPDAAVNKPTIPLINFSTITYDERMAIFRASIPRTNHIAYPVYFGGGQTREPGAESVDPISAIIFAYLSDGTSVEAETASSGVTVIGEGMQRVNNFASTIPGARTLDDMPVFSGTKDQITSQMMQYNRQWILNEFRSGRTLIDIGIDLNRPNPSIFYNMEQSMIKNYQLLHSNSLNILKP